MSAGRGKVGGVSSLRLTVVFPCEIAEVKCVFTVTVYALYGTSHANNPYEYAGNNPLALLDPLGLRALTDEEMEGIANNYNAAVDDAQKSFWGRIGSNLMSVNTIVGIGAMVVGGVLLATGVGTVAGTMLIGFGADTVFQQAISGDVDYVQSAISGLTAPIGGALAGKVVTKVGAVGLKRIAIHGAVDGATGGFAGGNYNYFRYGSGINGSIGDYVTTVGGETLTGAGMGSLSSVTGRGITTPIRNHMDSPNVTVRPESYTAVMGRDMSNHVIPYADNLNASYYQGSPNYTVLGEKFGKGSWQQTSESKIHNALWIGHQMAEGKQLIDIGAPHGSSLPSSPYYNIEKALVRTNELGGYSNYVRDESVGKFD